MTKTWEWQYTYTSNGWFKQETYLDIIQDLTPFITTENIPIPVVLFIDGAKCHVSIEMAEICLKSRIQPLLLHSNTTHLSQALDLTFFVSLKVGLKAEEEQWHRETDNIGSNLNKYSIVELVYKVTERIIADKHDLITKGFKQAGILPWNPLAPNHIRMEPSKVYSIEASVENEDDVVSKEQTHNEANLNEEKICNEVNVKGEVLLLLKRL